MYLFDTAVCKDVYRGFTRYACRSADTIFQCAFSFCMYTSFCLSVYGSSNSCMNASSESINSFDIFASVFCCSSFKFLHRPRMYLRLIPFILFLPWFNTSVTFAGKNLKAIVPSASGVCRRDKRSCNSAISCSSRRAFSGRDIRFLRPSYIPKRTRHTPSLSSRCVPETSSSSI